MIVQVIKSIIFSTGIGAAFWYFQFLMDSNYLIAFLKSELITLLIALLAINTATLGLILTKIRDLIEKQGGSEFFQTSKNQMLLSVKEQIVSIFAAVVFLTIQDSDLVKFDHLKIVIEIVIFSIFFYSINILSDTAKSVFVIINFNNEE